MNKTNRRERSTYTPYARSLLVVAIAAAALPAAAQQRAMLEEIIVTAEHREASLQDTQISLSAFSADNIAEMGISNGLDMGQYVPNLNAQAFVGGRTGVSYNIRGIGNAETLITFDPAVSVYIDGVLIAKNTGSLLDVLELERIEVLRGPQGTLYGRNTMGGAVNYVTQKPHNEFEGSVKATLGRYDQRDLRAMLNVPLLGADSPIGELNMRVSAATLNRDGIQKNRYENARQSELGTRDRDVAMVHLQWQPVDTLSVVYSYDRTRIDERPESVWLTGSNPNRPLGPVVAPYVQKESTRPSGGYYDGLFRAITDVDGHALTVAWDITDNMTLHSLTGYREMSNYGEQDTDGTPLTLLDTRDVQENESISQEFRLVGSAMDNRLDYSLGLFYMDEKGDVFNETRTPAGPGVNFAKYRNEAVAVYGQFTYAFTDRFNATFGVRYTEEDRQMEKAIVNGIYFVDPPFLGDIRTLNPSAIYPKASRSYDNVSPMASVSYNWTEDLMTYLKVSSGYQSGGFNARDATVTDFQNGFDEETIIAYELGMKSTWNDRYQVNGALWFSDYDDKRVNQFNPETLASIQRNAGAVEIWGVELELLAQLTDNLQAGLNYGHVDHKFVTYDTIDAQTGAVVDLSDQSNFPYSARNSASAHLAYEVPMDWALFRARIDWSYRDNLTFLVPQPERNSSGPLHLWNARVSLDEIRGPGDTSMRVSLWAKNLTNEGYWNFGVNLYETFGFDFNTYGEPRTFGVDLELNF